MRERRHLGRTITVLLLGVMLVLVPCGRAIQRLLAGALSPYLLAVSGTVCAALYVAVLVAKRRPPSVTVLFLWLFALATLVIAIRGIIGESVEIAHPILYAAISAAAASSFRRPSLALGSSIALTAAIGDEVLQYVTPGRYFDSRDILLNVLGALIGALCTAPFITWGGRSQASLLKGSVTI